MDAAEFNFDRMQVAQAAWQVGVHAIVIPAIKRANFSTVAALAKLIPGGAYALGIHPLFVSQAAYSDLAALRLSVEHFMSDPHFVAIGEIGLDFFVPEISSGALRRRQEFFYTQQLKLAAEFGLPVILHARRSQDIILKHLRHTPGLSGGIVHAFSGSAQQAHVFIEHGFALGLGGAITYERALQIRSHASELPLEHLVLETDAPDIPPARLYAPNRRNQPAELAHIADILAQLRHCPIDEVVRTTSANALRVLPRLATLLKA